MAKQSLPSVEDYKGPTVPKPTELPNPPPTREELYEQRGRSVDEVVEEFQGYAARMVDVRMTGEQPNKFKMIARHLEDIGAQLSDGSPVNNNRRVALWLIENFKIPNR